MHALTVSAYMTLAPPPATIVQMRPLGFKTVNFREELVCDETYQISTINNKVDLWKKSKEKKKFLKETSTKLIITNNH